MTQMTTILIILIVVFVIGSGFGAAAWYFLRRRLQSETQKTTEETVARGTLPFRWRYITAPIIVLLLFIILSAVFYPKLPAEVGYQFKPDGTPGNWLSREMAMVLMLVPQLLLAILAGVITWGITRLGILSKQSEIIGIKPQNMLALMGNIAVLPQLILGFTILDIFIYNSYQIDIMPTWVFLLLLGLSAVALGVLLVRIILKARGRLFHQLEDNSD